MRRSQKQDWSAPPSHRLINGTTPEPPFDVNVVCALAFFETAFLFVFGGREKLKHTLPSHSFFLLPPPSHTHDAARPAGLRVCPAGGCGPGKRGSVAAAGGRTLVWHRPQGRHAAPQFPSRAGRAPRAAGGWPHQRVHMNVKCCSRGKRRTQGWAAGLGGGRDPAHTLSTRSFPFPHPPQAQNLNGYNDEPNGPIRRCSGAPPVYGQRCCNRLVGDGVGQWEWMWPLPTYRCD